MPLTDTSISPTSKFAMSSVTLPSAGAGSTPVGRVYFLLKVALEK